MLHLWLLSFAKTRWQCSPASRPTCSRNYLSINSCCFICGKPERKARESPAVLLHSFQNRGKRREWPAERGWTTAEFWRGYFGITDSSFNNRIKQLIVHFIRKPHWMLLFTWIHSFCITSFDCTPAQLAKVASVHNEKKRPKIMPLAIVKRTGCLAACFRI